MRRLVGRQTQEVDSAAFSALRSGWTELVLDLGTGDGKHVLALARNRPDALVLGLDASQAAMREAATRAGRRPDRGGTPNAVFVWAAVEKLPEELRDVDEVHVLMPWGSLLRAFVEPSAAVLSSIAAVCRPGASFLVTLNLHAWQPPVPEVGGAPEPTPESVRVDLAPRYARAGWRIDRVEYPTQAVLEALGTSWTKRLGSTRRRLSVLLMAGTIN